jgi:iron complex transport system substrate-binding protein
VKALAAGGTVMALMTGAVEARPLRVMSLDQCADQYVLALAPDAEVALSPRADDPDAWMRDAARGRPRTRPTLESAIAFGPDVVVRYWGGDARLLARLENSGVRVATLTDAQDFKAVEANIDTVSKALGRPERGQALISRMRDRLAVAAPTANARRGEALYLTPGGFTAGAGTLVDAVLRAAGFANAARSSGFAPVSVERIALSPPTRFVLGFFDQVRADWRGPGRHPVVRRTSAGRVAAELPGAVLTCPAWFAADAAVMLKAAE